VKRATSPDRVPVQRNSTTMKGRASTWGENRLHSRICRAKHRVLAMMAASFTSSEKPSEMHNRYRPTMAMAMPIHTRREGFFRNSSRSSTGTSAM